MTKQKLARLFVAPEFKTKIKVESANHNMSIIEYTRKLAREDETFNIGQLKKKGGLKFDF